LLNIVLYTLSMHWQLLNKTFSPNEKERFLILLTVAALE